MMEVYVPVGGSVLIGKDVRVHICQLFLRTDDYDVRIGIDAPSNVRVDRAEIRKKREKSEKGQGLGTAYSKGPPRKR